jgi:DNA-binding PadR family transcriptional regulator
MENEQILDSLFLELRRGATTMAVMLQLKNEQYGYSLLSNLASAGVDIEQGTLYPLLRRLEAQGLLSSIWRLEGTRPRRYYLLSDQGQMILPQIEAEWSRLVKIMSQLSAE